MPKEYRHEQLGDLLLKARFYNTFFNSLIDRYQEPEIVAEKLLPHCPLRQEQIRELETTIQQVCKAKQLLDELSQEYKPEQSSSGQEALFKYLFGYSLATPAQSYVKRFTFALGFYLPTGGSRFSVPGFTDRVFEFHPQEGKRFTYQKAPHPDLHKARPWKLGELCFRAKTDYIWTGLEPEQGLELIVRHELKHIADSFIYDGLGTELAAHLYTLNFMQEHTTLCSASSTFLEETERGLNDDIANCKAIIKTIYDRCGLGAYWCTEKSDPDECKWVLPEPLVEKLKTNSLTPEEEVFLDDFSKYTGRIDVLKGFGLKIKNALRELLGFGLDSGTISFTLALVPIEDWPEFLGAFKNGSPRLKSDEI